jgi:hypothetical protein
MDNPSKFENFDFVLSTISENEDFFIRKKKKKIIVASHNL